MRVWIVCSGEAAIEFPRRCTAEEYRALREKALDGGAGAGGIRRVAANGRRVYCSPRLSARETARLCVADAEAEREELLDELPCPADKGGRARPLWIWRLLLWLRRLFGADGAEGRRRAAALIDRLEQRGEDCILISHPAVIEALIDELRRRGFCVQRTGLGRIRPGEQMLLSRRSEHCGGCQHNCLLSNPGCSVGRDKASRMNKRFPEHGRGGFDNSRATGIITKASDKHPQERN